MTVPSTVPATHSPERSSRLPRVDWRGELVVAALATAESAALWMVLDLVARAGDAPGVPGWAIGLLVVAAALLPRWLEAAGLWDRGYAAGTVLAIAVTTLVAIKAACFPQMSWLDADWMRDTFAALGWQPSSAEVSVWLIVVVSAYAWWRGRTRAEPGPETALTMLRVGTAVVLVGALAHAVAAGRATTLGESAAVLVFFASALGALAVARLRPDGTRSGQALGPRWLGAQLVPVIAVIIAAVGVAAILSPGIIDAVLWLLAPAVWALSVIFRLFVVVVAIIAFIIVSPILWLLSRTSFEPGGIRWRNSLGDPGAWVQQTAERAAELPPAIRYVAAAAILLILFSGAARLVLRRRRPAQSGAEEERVSVRDERGLVALALDLLRRARQSRSSVADPLAGLRRDPRWRYTVAIREAYAAFLRWSQSLGVPRPPGRTPSEHADRLAERLQREDARSALDALTAGYNRARYGAAPASAKDANQVLAAWARLRQGE